MSKYFQSDVGMQLSKYKGELSGRMTKTVDYLITCLGDVSLPLSIVKAFSDYFHFFGGRYDVRRDVDSVKGLYQFYQRFPNISAKAFEEIAFRYISDLFTSYSMDTVFDKLIKTYGETDKSFLMFIDYIEKCADILQEKYTEDASKLDKYREIYHVDGLLDDYILYLKYLVTRKHMSADKIIECLPTPDIIKSDKQQLYQISKDSRSFIGCGYPVSYLMTESLAKGIDLKKYGEQPSYYISISGKREASTFTTAEFIDSVKKKKLIRKKEK